MRETCIIFRTSKVESDSINLMRQISGEDNYSNLFSKTTTIQIFILHSQVLHHYVGFLFKKWERSCCSHCFLDLKEVELSPPRSCKRRTFLLVLAGENG
ncbi:uncharacterized protein J3R85_005825 [Psidium guajava]|nr:uncharacterized protein J3R85_005825 [Psidium guajava]